MVQVEMRGSWWIRLLSRARPQAGSFAVLIGMAFVGMAVDLLKPWPLKLIVDYVLPGKTLPSAVRWLAFVSGGGTRTGLLAWCALGTLLVFLTAWLIRALAAFLRLQTGFRMFYRLASEVFDHLQRLSLTFHSRRPAGDLVKRVQVDCGCIRELAFDVCLPAVVAIATLLVIFGIIWRMDAALAYLALLVIPVIALVINKFADPMGKSYSRQSEVQGEMMARAEQVLSAVPIIQAFGREHEESRRFSMTTKEVGRAYLCTVATGYRFKAATGATLAVGTALLTAIGGRHVLEGKIQLGDLLVFLSYLAMLYAPVETLAYLSMSYASASAGARRIFEILDTDEQVKDLPGARPIKAGGHGIHVVFDSVSFSYQPGAEVLHEVALEAEAGKTVAFVGPTGAGKTTLVSLILRLHDPSRGRILFDGADIRELQIASLRSQVAIVLQDPFLLPMTVAENIAYARPDAPREDIVAAAEAAHADEFIRELPQGYDTLIGERGSTLSGGQRQRIAIARAFLKNASVLILDEPTSALDAKTEVLLLDAMRRLMAGRTTFIIGHRLSTVRNADRIVVLEHGRIAAMGTHEELIAAGGLYARLFQIQFQEPELAANRRSVSK